jgi:hypothetical protein
MSFTITTTQILVLEETQAPGYPPMLLPWEKRLLDAGTTARIGGGVIPAGANNLEVVFPGVEMITTLWFYPEADVEISLGNGNNTKVTVHAGGCIGFTHGIGLASGSLRVTYGGAEDSSYAVVWGGT